MLREIGIDDMIAASRSMRAPAPAPLAIVPKATRCQVCGYRIDAAHEARQPTGGVYIHPQCLDAFAPYDRGGR
jgi:hypothetical protein